MCVCGGWLQGGGRGSHLELRAAHSTRLAHVVGEGAASSASTRLNASSCCATTRRAASGGVAQSLAGAAAAVCVGASECIPTKSTTCKLANRPVVSFCIHQMACMPVATHLSASQRPGGAGSLSQREDMAPAYIVCSPQQTASYGAPETTQWYNSLRRTALSACGLAVHSPVASTLVQCEPLHTTDDVWISEGEGEADGGVILFTSREMRTNACAEEGRGTPQQPSDSCGGCGMLQWCDASCACASTAATSTVELTSTAVNSLGVLVPACQCPQTAFVSSPCF